MFSQSRKSNKLRIHITYKLTSQPNREKLGELILIRKRYSFFCLKKKTQEYKKLAPAVGYVLGGNALCSRQSRKKNIWISSKCCTWNELDGMFRLSSTFCSEIRSNALLVYNVLCWYCAYIILSYITCDLISACD